MAEPIFTNLQALVFFKGRIKPNPKTDKLDCLRLSMVKLKK
jgi:hypothetical protein